MSERKLLFSNCLMFLLLFSIVCEIFVFYTFGIIFQAYRFCSWKKIYYLILEISRLYVRLISKCSKTFQFSNFQHFYIFIFSKFESDCLVIWNRRKHLISRSLHLYFRLILNVSIFSMICRVFKKHNRKNYFCKSFSIFRRANN